MVTGGACGARPPSRSVVRVAPARPRGFAGAGPAAVALAASPFLLRGGGAPPALGGRRAAPVAPQLRWVRGRGDGGAAPPPALGPVWEGGGGGGARCMCAGVAWLKPKGFAALGARAATGYGLVVQGEYGSDQNKKKKTRVGASECVPQGQLNVRKKHGYLTGLAWVRGDRVAIQCLLSYPGWVVRECVP